MPATVLDEPKTQLHVGQQRPRYQRVKFEPLMDTIIKRTVLIAIQSTCLLFDK